jgi:hypothetical protein
MKAPLLRFALLVVALMMTTLHGQQPAAAIYTQTLTYVKVTPGKGSDYEALLSQTSAKIAQIRANAGEIVSCTLLRAVIPAGKEARADYIISSIAEGAPLAPASPTETEARLKKSGASLSYKEYIEKRDALSALVAVEMWQPHARVAGPKKGHYLFINYMKVKDAAYPEFEQNIWRPLAEEWVKQGAMSGWVYAAKMLPGGTETPYSAYSADMFPTWQAAFAPRSMQSVFAKVHPGKDYQAAADSIPKLRDLARRELWVVVDRIEKAGGAQKSTE